MPDARRPGSGTGGPQLQVPPEVRLVLGRDPRIGSADDVLPLLTVDGEGYPHVCLLSTAHLEADERRIRAVVRSRQTRQNLDRAGRGCLVVVENGAVHYCKVTVDAARELDDVCGYSFALALHKADRLPDTVVHAMTYESTADLAALEQWETSRRLMRSLR